MAFSQARAVWDSACDIPATADLKLHDLAFPPTFFSAETEETASLRLRNMRHAQPAIAAVALSQLALLNQLGVRSDMQAGHSFGEVMALHCAGVFDAHTAMTIACERADAMSHAAANSSGSMLAVQASASAVNELLTKACDGLAPDDQTLDELTLDELTLANDNAPEQVVLSGDAERLEQAARLMNSQGINSQILPVAAAFHSPQVDPAVQPFAQKLAQHPLAQASSTVYANSTAHPYPTEKSALIKVLSEQIGKPVLFRQTLEAMHAAGATVFLEVGPGSVLTNLVRQSLPAVGVTAIALDDKHSNGTTALLCAVGQLAISGIAVDVPGLYEGLPAPQARVQPSKHSVKLSGSNYQKPYPPQGDQATVPGPIVQSIKTAGASQAAQATHTQGTTQSFQEVTAVDTSPHQSLAAVNPTMVMQKQPSASADTGAPHQSHSMPSTLNQENVSNDIPVRQAQTSNTVLHALLNDVSARHAEYLATVSSAHQSYLRLAAGLIDGVDGSALSQPAELIERGRYETSMPDSTAVSTPSATVASSSLNGHSPLNGTSPSPTVTAASIMNQAPDTAAPSTNGQMSNGAALSTNSQTSNGAALSTNGQMSNGAALSTNGQMSNGAALSTNGQTSNGAAQSLISTDLVRSLIADKTGYPEEMIEDDMDLSGELGIDSIKQVEVLSALRAQVPQMKDVGTADMGQLRTIRQIADFFG